MPLIKNELLKIFKRKGTYVMIGLIVALIIGVGLIVKSDEGFFEGESTSGWEISLTEENEYNKAELEEFKENKIYASNLEQRIAINEYRLTHNMPPNEQYTMWDFVADMTPMIDFIAVFTIIIAASIVASEFNWGTIKLLLIRPIKREKILASKYITVCIFGGLFIGLAFILAMGVGATFFGIAETVIPHLSYVNGQVVEQSMGVYLLTLYGLQSISMIMLATMAFMISAAFRNSSLAIGLSLFLLLMGTGLTQLISIKFDWAKYILFANTDLLQYFNGTPMVEGMTLTFSIVMLSIYFLVFQAIAFYVFKKRDVLA